MPDKQALLDRLRSEIDPNLYMVARGFRNPDGEEAAAEIERLREALERIANADHATVMCDPFGSCRIARAARADRDGGEK